MIAAVIVAILCALSWLITCALVKFVTLCFGWGFSWLIATGIWLLMMLIRSLIK